jgi:Protein of unknown function (DUF1501)
MTKRHIHLAESEGRKPLWLGCFPSNSENGNRGTDHGHANCMFMMGGAVKGGKIYTQWPGMNDDQLYQDRDLAVTTDFRSMLGEIVAKHLGNRDLGGVFPGFGNDPRKFLNILKS